MTILPFVTRTAPTGQDALVVVASGWFRSPCGGRGVFSGCYRLEHLLAVAGRLAAAGVYTGELTDRDGRRVGLGARRWTTPFDVSRDGDRLLVRIGPVQVDLLGLLVSVDGLTLDSTGTPLECALHAAVPTPEGLRGSLETSGPVQPARSGNWLRTAQRHGPDGWTDHTASASAVSVPAPASAPLT